MLVIDLAKWGWPQLAVVGLLLFSTFVSLLKNGQPRAPYNAGYTMGDLIIWIVLLSFGGFFA